MRKAVMRLALVSALILVGVSGAAGTTNSLGNDVLARALNIELGLVQPGPHEAPVSSGALYAALQSSGALDDRANAVQGGNAGGPNSAACGQRFTGGGTMRLSRP